MKRLTRGLVAGAIALASMTALATPAHAAIYCERTPIPDGSDTRVFLYICVYEDLENFVVHAQVDVGGVRITGAAVARNNDPISGVNDLRVCVFYVFHGEEEELCHIVPLDG